MFYPLLLLLLLFLVFFLFLLLSFSISIYFPSSSLILVVLMYIPGVDQVRRAPVIRTLTVYSVNHTTFDVGSLTLTDTELTTCPSGSRINF